MQCILWMNIAFIHSWKERSRVYLRVSCNCTDCNSTPAEGIFQLFLELFVLHPTFPTAFYIHREKMGEESPN